MSFIGACSDRLKLIQNNGITITKNYLDGSNAAVYGKKWIQSTENRSISWEIALEGDPRYVFLGLVSKEHHGSTEIDIYHGPGGYVVDTFYGLQFVDGQCAGSYAQKLNDGETITITLNLSQSRIESTKGNHEKIIFDQIKRDNNTFYRFAVSLFKNSSLTVRQSEGGFDDEDRKNDVKCRWIKCIFCK